MPLTPILPLRLPFIGDEESSAGKLLRHTSKSSHFHCQKCDYICTDTNKVVAHRRQHNKTDFIRLSGFRKVASSEPCFSGSGEASSSQDQQQQQQHNNSNINSSSGSGSEEGGGGAGAGESPVGGIKCHYSEKQTHYHCLVCNSVVLNRSQLAVHRHKGQPK